jgi:hypothetical protein
MGYKGYNDDGELEWEQFQDRCERMMREQGLDAAKACGCDTKGQLKTKTLSKGFEMKSNWNTKAGGGGAAEGPEIISKAATKAIKAIQSHVESLHDAANDVEALLDGKKSGRTFSADNAQALRDHAQSLHNLADDHKGVVQHLKKITTAADDLATRLQGSEPTFASPNEGTPAAGQQEGSGKRSRGTYEMKSGSGTITENDMADALRQLRGIRAQGRVPQETFVEKQLKAAQCATQVHQQQFQEQLAQARQESRKICW